MNNEITTPQKQQIDVQTIKNYLFTSETKLTDKQQQMFIQLAVRHNLDPFKREIYAIAYGREFSIVTGYQVYIERAEASGKLNGWHCINTPSGAKITIYRKDWEHPFEWEASYEEFDKGQSSWKKMRDFMIKKVCIGQGFRLAFPAELGGLPYLVEEMEGATPFSTVANESVKQPQSKSKAETPMPPEAPAEEEVITTVDKITKKGLDFRILGEKDMIYITRQETFATLAKSAKDAGLQVKINHKNFIIIDITLLEPPAQKDQTQEKFLSGLEADAVAEGLKSEV